MDGLTVGCMVHYVAYGTPGGEYAAGAYRAAIVAEVKDASIGLCVLMVINPTGAHWNTAKFEMSDRNAPGTWHWIEKA